MPLPGIDITFQNGALEAVEISPDGVFGVVGNIEPNATLLVNTVYTFKSLDDVEAAGITDSIENHIIYKFFQEYYSEAGTGAEIWFIGIARDQVFTAQTDAVKKLIDTSKLKLRGLFFVFNPDGTYVGASDEEIDSSIKASISPYQVLLEDYVDTKKCPMFAIFEGYNFSGTMAGLINLRQRDEDRIGLIIGDTEKRTGLTASKGSAIGLLAGRLAKYPVHVNPGKVRNGKLTPEEVFILDTPIESADNESVHDKGIITFANHVGRAGYFFSDDPLAVPVSNDYSQITHRRTIDKAFRIAYDTILDYLLDDVDVNNDGTVQTPYAKSLEGVVTRALFNSMTSNGELSFDPNNPNDTGVIVQVDLTHNLASTSKLKLKKLQVKPKGHNRYIDVPIGFVPVAQN